MDDYGRTKPVKKHPNVIQPHRGRPRRNPRYRRDIRLVMRINQTEEELIDFRCQIEGKTRTQWLREIVMEAARGTTKPPEYRITRKDVVAWKNGKLVTLEKTKKKK